MLVYINSAPSNPYFDTLVTGMLHLTRRPILDQNSLDWTTLDQTMRNRTLLDWTTQKCSSIQSIYISVKKTIIEFSFCKF